MSSKSHHRNGTDRPVSAPGASLRAGPLRTSRAVGSRSISIQTARLTGPVVYLGKAVLVDFKRLPPPPNCDPVVGVGVGVGEKGWEKDGDEDGDDNGDQEEIFKVKTDTDTDTGIAPPSYAPTSPPGSRSATFIEKNDQNDSTTTTTGNTTTDTQDPPEQDIPDQDHPNQHPQPNNNHLTPTTAEDIEDIADKITALTSDLRELQAGCRGFDGGTIGMLKGEGGIVDEVIVGRLASVVGRRLVGCLEGYEGLMERLRGY